MRIDHVAIAVNDLDSAVKNYEKVLNANKVEVEVVDKLEPEGGDKFKRVVSKVDGPDKKAEKEKGNKASLRRNKAGAR